MVIDLVKRKLHPLQILVLGYLLITLTGALLLSLPVSNAKGAFQPFIDSLFVATSGISTSGLTVVDIGSYYSLFGQIVLLCIFQIGGIGYMTFIIFIAYLMGEKVSLITGVVARESLATKSHGYQMLGRFFRNVLFYTIILEAAGAVILTWYWMKEFSILRSVYLGIFHSVSAFCTAGFSTFPLSLMGYKNSLTVNLTVSIISLAGGIGFFVIADVIDRFLGRRKNIPVRLSLHSKMALFVTLMLVSTGAAGILVTENWGVGIDMFQRVIYSFFQSISASTTDGFNTIDIGSMSASGLTILMALMFVGASPGSTGGGIKTTTLGVIFCSILAFLRGKENTTVFERELPVATVSKAFTVFSMFALIAAVDLVIMAGTESASYLRVLFEIISALGNTGLSTGITSTLSSAGKIVLIITMFIGRVGPISIAVAILGKPYHAVLRCPKEDTFVG